MEGGWYRWSIKAPSVSSLSSVSTPNNAIKGMTEIGRSADKQSLLSLHDTSPSLLTSTIPDTCCDDMDIFVPESQYLTDNNSNSNCKQNVNNASNNYLNNICQRRPQTPVSASNITMDFLVQSSLRQRKIRTIDRVTTRASNSGNHMERKEEEEADGDDDDDDDIGDVIHESPVRPASAFTQDLLLTDDDSEDSNIVGYKKSELASENTPRRLFPLSPNLLFSTPLPVNHHNLSNNHASTKRSEPVNYIADLIASPHATFGNTQLLFENTPLNGADRENEGEPTKDVLDEGKTELYNGNSPVFLPASFEQLEIGCVVPTLSSSPPPSLLNDENQSELSAKEESQPVEAAKTIAIQTSAVDFKPLADIVQGAKKKFRSTPPSPCYTPLLCKKKKVSFLGAANVPSSSSSSPEYSSMSSFLSTAKMTRKSSNLRISTNSLVAPKYYDIPKPQDNMKWEDVVWARWKPDRCHHLVPADLVEHFGSSTRSMWKARLHSSRTQGSFISLYEGDFVRLVSSASVMSGNNMSKTVCHGSVCRLRKRPNSALVIESWQTGKTVVVRDCQSGCIMSVPSRHIFIDNLSLLQQNVKKHVYTENADINTIKPTDNDNDNADNPLFSGLSFIITSGNEKKSVKKREITGVITKYGGRVIEQAHKYSADTVLVSTEPRRTFKYLMAVVLGIPRVSVKWITDSVDRMCHLPFKDFSVDHYTSPLSHRQLNDAVFFLTGRDTFKNEFGCILKALGAQIVPSINSRNSRQCVYELYESQPSNSYKSSSKRVTISIERFIECIITNNFSCL